MEKFGWGMTQTPWKLSSFESIIDLLILHAFIRIFYILRLSFMYPCMSTLHICNCIPYPPIRHISTRRPAPL